MIKLLLITVLSLGRFIVAPAEDSPIIVKDPNTSRYVVRVTPNDVPTKVSFGERQKFTPRMQSSKWDNEAWLSIEHQDKLSITSQKPSLDNGKLQIAVGDRTHRYYLTPNGDVEYEIEFAAKPASRFVVLDINFPDGLNFFYQDTLENEYAQDNFGYKTLHDYLVDHNRPDNVVGSYAVYWNKRNNEYKTGKFCHFYRPEAIDAEGKRVWCTIYIDPEIKKLELSMPQKFLDTAKYPVILDPTIGYTTPGGTNMTVSDSIFANRFACGTNGTTTAGTFHLDIGSTVTETEARGCIYTDNAGTAASQAKLSSNEAELSIVKNQWNTGAITPPAFASGTDYWIGVHLHNAKLTFDTVTAGYEDCEYFTLAYTPAQNDLPANFDASPSTVAREFSYYVTYTEDAGGATGAQVIIITN